ncbi:RidA family protein [Roseibium sp.]|uniref:RidA family protein n=1 Tax=Roseibium sp. TaxID=1936156 RepID=UPI003264E6AA
MTIVRKNSERLGIPVGPYTHAVVHDRTLYTSGFTAFGTEAHSGSAGAQTRAVLDQLDSLAREFGKSLADIVKVTVFAIRPDDIAEIRDVLSERYDNAVPASSMVLVASLFAPELRVEIEAIFGL